MWSSVESGGDGRAAPCARAKHSATLLGGHVYVLGGRGAGGALPLRDFWRYSLASGTWERLECRGEAPPSLQEHTATAHRGRLYVFGGEPGEISSETPLWIYDTESQLWRKLPGQSGYVSSVRRRPASGGHGAGDAGAGGVGPRGRRGHSAHALKDCLLIYGGYKDLRGSTNELWAFHYESESWQAVRARGGPARHRHAAALHRARLYVHAGQRDLRACADLWHYDTISHVWTAVRAASKPSPGARCGHAGVRAGDHLYIFGGEAQGRAAADMWRFHFESECWERIVSPVKCPAARVDARALLITCPPLGRACAPADAAPAAPAAGPAAAGALLARLTLPARRAARCSYTALAERDSTESLVRHEAALAKSLSAYVIDRRQPADGGEGDGPLPKSASVRFGRPAPDDELCTSDYASADAVDGAAPAGFSNPHYLGPDVCALRAALTPDSGAGDIELRDLGAGGAGGGGRLHVLLVGGREAAHAALLRAPLSLWAYRLL